MRTEGTSGAQIKKGVEGASVPFKGGKKRKKGLEAQVDAHLQKTMATL